MLYFALICLFIALGFVHGYHRSSNRNYYHNSTKFNSNQRQIKRYAHKM